MSSLSAEEIAENTWLSNREAEFFIRYYRERLPLERDVAEVASEMEVKTPTGHKMRDRIKEKYSKSQSTVDLFDDIEAEMT
jgi:hypothetical protein